MIETDGTENMRVLGANATTAVSIACARAAAKAKGIQLYQHLSDIFTELTNEGKSASTGTATFPNDNPDRTLPIPLMNIVNGGKHAGSGLAIQEFMIASVGVKDFSESIRMGSETYHTLASILSDKLRTLLINVGDEGGFAPTIKDTDSVLSFICDAVSECGYSVGTDFIFGIDCVCKQFLESCYIKIHNR